MKKTEIQPGKLVAQQDRFRGGPMPAVFLSADLYSVGYSGERSKAGKGATRPVRQEWGGGGAGYLVATAGGYAPDVEFEKRLAYLRKIDPAAAQYRERQEAKAVANSLARYGGDYDTEVAQYRERQEAKAVASRQRADAARKASERAERAVEALKGAAANAGRPVISPAAERSRDVGELYVRLSVEDAEALAGLLTVPDLDSSKDMIP